MNTKFVSRIILVNLAFWTVAILAPVLIRLIPTSSGTPAKFFEFGIPMFQILFALGTTHLIRTALAGKKDS